LYASLIPL